MSTTTPKGTLYLVPTPLDFGCDTDAGLTTALPAHTLHVAAGLTHWITENAKSTRAFLKRVGTHTPLAAPLQEQRITELPREVHKKGDHTSASGFDAKSRSFRNWKRCRKCCESCCYDRRSSQNNVGC